MDTDHLSALAADILDAAHARNLKIATAESCTGGLVAATFVDIPGSSRVFDRGFVTYSNTAKRDVLGVPEDLLIAHGAVSEPVVCAMVQGALQMSGCDLAVAITGIAGPGGGTADKPVGLVHFAAGHKDGRLIHEERRFGDLGRSIVREKSVDVALTLIKSLVQDNT